MDQLIRSYEEKNEKVGAKNLTCEVRYINPDLVTEISTEEHEKYAITAHVSNVEEIDQIRKVEAKAIYDISLFDLGYNYEYVMNWHMIRQPEKDDLYYLLRFMFENHLKTTIQIGIGDMYFNCHLAVLQVYSKFFMEIESALIVKLPIEKVSQKAFMILYKWMLSDNPVIERKHIVEVFLAATYLRIENILQQCWFYFDNICTMTDDAACLLYVETGREPALNVLRNLMLTRIGKFFMTFVASRDFLDLPEKHLCFLLSSSTVCVNTEIEIFFVAIRWMQHKWETRKRCAKNLMQCVRFALMPIWYLVNLTRNRDNKIIEYVVTNPEIEDTINEAISTVTSSMYNGICEREIAHSVNNDIDKGVMTATNYPQRQWIKDKACLYHHLLGCPNMRELKYDDFVMYLKYLQLQPNDHWRSCLKMNVQKSACKCCGMHPVLFPLQVPRQIEKIL